jgi:hypothetical protein
MKRNLKTSEHLQKILLYIADNPLKTNWDIMKATGSTRVPSDVSEINQNFRTMESDLYIEDVHLRISDNGKRVTGWLLISHINGDLATAKKHAKYMLEDFRKVT